MCFTIQQKHGEPLVEKRFGAEKKYRVPFDIAESISGFTYPQTQVITNTEPKAIQLFHWGLIPNWSKEESIREYTLNARIETIKEKPSFRNCINNRCLIIADGFYEWQWLTKSGSKKQKYLITLPDSNLFALAGLWSTWKDEATGITKDTYTIVTTEANELMAEIHNNKKRMPVILNPNEEASWLGGIEIDDFKKPVIDLLATPIKASPSTPQFDLF